VAILYFGYHKTPKSWAFIRYHKGCWFVLAAGRQLRNRSRFRDFIERLVRSSISRRTLSWNGSVCECGGEINQRSIETKDQPHVGDRMLFRVYGEALTPFRRCQLLKCITQEPLNARTVERNPPTVNIATITFVDAIADEWSIPSDAQQNVSACVVATYVHFYVCLCFVSCQNARCHTRCFCSGLLLSGQVAFLVSKASGTPGTLRLLFRRLLFRLAVLSTVYCHLIVFLVCGGILFDGLGVPLRFKDRSMTIGRRGCGFA